MEASTIWLLLFFSFCTNTSFVFSATNPFDAGVLKSLSEQWKNTPPSWGKSNDPCGATPESSWEGVTCVKSRVTALGLSSLGIVGQLSGDIGRLTQLQSLDLSQNRGFTGSISSGLGDLINLSILSLAGCSFSGSLPDELGNLAKLTFFGLNSNKFTGPIPASLGKLTNVYWLDFSDNQLTGPLPVSSATSPGLDLLLHAKHFHFNKNKLSGTIPPQLFSSEMVLIHVLLDGNQFTGSVPSTLGLVTTLEVLRVDRNRLSGDVPTNLNNLTNVYEMHLANNKFLGPIPDLTGMDALSYVDLSNNSFSQSETPAWFTTLQSLTTLVFEYGPIQGTLPPALFSFPQLQQVKLKNNSFNGTFSMGGKISSQLQLVDMENNDIDSVTLGSSYTNSLILMGNPVCTTTLANTAYCQLHQTRAPPYSTSLANCQSTTCPVDQSINPQSCACAYPYQGTLYFRAPSFREVSNATLFQSLERSLWLKFELTPGSVSLQDLFFNTDDYLQVHLELFPATGKDFTRSDILKMGFQLTNQTYKPPAVFGPYYFIASPFMFSERSRGTSMSMGLIIGIAVGCILLLLLLVGVGVYAIRQKKRAETAIVLSKPFASWAPGGKDKGGAPQLKGARWFTYEELKKCTNNFSQNNEIGFGGYGKVYRGMLSEGAVVAIKRAQQGSMQGGAEFRNEIELLSRVHHKNLVSLVGFCFEQGEQMLVYEYMPNGTLREALAGKSGIHLDWKRRIRMALGAARGLAYLHELADPPIIHRDVKTTNILLDENLVAKVADFGLSKLVSDTGKGHVSTTVKGTLGYLDPEYYMTQQLSEKSDVYSFGVVMLELITSKMPIDKGKYIVREVRSVMNRTTDQHYIRVRDEMMDPSIRTTGNLPGFENFLELAMQCVEEESAERPTMSEVVKRIETMLQNEGLSSNTTSAPSSATDFYNAKGGGGSVKHPYEEGMQKRYGNDHSDAFDYSGGFSMSSNIEPK